MSAPEQEPITIQGAAGAGDRSSPPRPAIGALPESLPILGLSDVVVFPGMVVPLLVESTSSLRLIDDVVAGDRFLGLVLQKQPEEDNPGPEDLWDHGCAARVLRMLKYPDNTVRVLVEGLRRFQLGTSEVREPYLRARVQFRRDLGEDSLEMTALVRQVRERFMAVVDASPALAEQVKVAALNTDDPGSFADLVAANLNLSLEDRQRLLGFDSVKDRFKDLLPLLAREQAVLALGSKIQKEVTTSLTKIQRDYFLREQMRAIQRELGEPDANDVETAQLRAQIDQAGLPESVKQVADKELERLRQMSPAAAEYTVARNYLDCLVNLPWTRSAPDKLDLAAAEALLDRQHYGLPQVKERLLEFLAVMKLNRRLKGPILCLVGPPGVGKTSLGQSVAEALGRPFARIALGGMRDEAEIRGHRRTYVGAMPGRIIQALRRAGANNPVMLLDELDKLGADFRGDPAAALLEVLDPAQNPAFADHYVDLPFDLSRVLFLTTANWLEPVHPALRDRLEVIELPSYTAEEKLQIARRHLLPRQFAEHGLKPAQVRFAPRALRYLIRQYTREAGVRQLDREIAALARKTARRVTRRPRARVRIDTPQLQRWLGPERFPAEGSERIRDCGIAVGLAWTPVGGDILFVEATRMAGGGKLLLTGSLGDVMKESAQAALSFLRAQSRQLGLDAIDLDKRDVHIHVPAGATPKDGPSAGLTLVVALASLFAQRPVRSDAAMTGEISLRGRVLPVGGIKEKALAAARAGIRELILPAANRKDWAEVPAEVRRKLKVTYVDRIEQALHRALGVNPAHANGRLVKTPHRQTLSRQPHA